MFIIESFIMKKLSIVLFLSVLALASCTKAIQTIDQVHEQWPSKTIKAPKNANIVQLVEAFNKALPTYSVGQYLKEAQLPEVEQQFIVITELNNGSLSFAEGSDDQSSESMKAHVWNRNDGHQLLVIVFDQMSSQVGTFAAFYDYDPNKGVLKPEASPIAGFTPSYPNAMVGIRLPEEGSDLVVTEYFMNWWSSIDHVYAWNGKSFGQPEVDIYILDQVQRQEDYDSYFTSSDPPVKYALIDIDGDDEPELWLASENEECQEVFSVVEGKPYYLAGTDFRRSLCFYDGVVGDVGGCGTGCYYTYYTKLKNSIPEFCMSCIQSNYYDMDTDQQVDVSEYFKNGEKISVEEGESIHASFGEPKEVTPNWISL